MNQGFFAPYFFLRTVLFFAFIAVTFSAPAQTNEYGGFFSLIDENDAYADFFGRHQDRHYTHGIKLTYLAGDRYLTNTSAALEKILPAICLSPDTSNVGITAGQSMFTPENILSAAPIPTDRPYAGWLYAGLIYQRRQEIATNFAVMESFEADFGIVGPSSIADDTQTLVHRLRFPQAIPQGWGNQLQDEPGIILKYARLWRWSPTAATAKFVDVIPRAGFELGNVFTFATAGASLRLGWNLPPDFGQQIIDSPASGASGFTRHTPWFFGYVFAGVDGRAIGHNITLDGNSFRSGPNVEKYYFVGDVSVGAAVQLSRIPWLRHVEVAYIHVNRTKEFKGQQGDDIFGSVLLKVSRSF